MTPYSNPHKNIHNDNHKLHNLHNDAPNMRYSDFHYNPYQTNDYDICDDKYDPIVDNIPSPSPSDVAKAEFARLSTYAYTEPHSDPYLSLNALTPTSKEDRQKLVCFAKFSGGTCTNNKDGNICDYLHDTVSLQQEWQRRQQKLYSSPYAPKGLSSPSHNPPSRILQNSNRPAGGRSSLSKVDESPDPYIHFGTTDVFHEYDYPSTDLPSSQQNPMGSN
jgi:hypothetical protein